MTTIKNREEIMEQLTELLKDFTFNPYDEQRDIYLYPDGTLDVFVNPGGNSWRNDDHYTIYTDMGVGTDLFGDEVYDVFEDWGFPEYAEALGVPAEELVKKTAACSVWYDAADEADVRDFECFVASRYSGFEEYYEKLREYRRDCIYDDASGFFTDWADSILTAFEEE